ncbi:hypothetical protein C8J57DRAFT_1602978 [Mycena rebaudengoi]|nr:hypothetical protein C8J57DRAFT_1602978 [Mycena rebaudengoi]
MSAILIASSFHFLETDASMWDAASTLINSYFQQSKLGAWRARTLQSGYRVPTRNLINISGQNTSCVLTTRHAAAAKPDPAVKHERKCHIGQRAWAAFGAKTEATREGTEFPTEFRDGERSVLAPAMRRPSQVRSSRDWLVLSVNTIRESEPATEPPLTTAKKGSADRRQAVLSCC